MLRYLIDTSTAIEALRGRRPELRERFTRHSAELATSTVVVAELLYGALLAAEPEARTRLVDGFADLLTVLDLDRAAASHAAEIRADLAEKGTPIGGYDVLIAGHARSRGLVVVTHNLGEFGRVDGLRAVDWLES